MQCNNNNDGESFYCYMHTYDYNNYYILYTLYYMNWASHKWCPKMFVYFIFVLIFIYDLVLSYCYHVGSFQLPYTIEISDEN